MKRPFPDDTAATENSVTDPSRKNISLKAYRRLKTSAYPWPALYRSEGDSDLWSNVDEEPLWY
jgi:hypothetical protein